MRDILAYAATFKDWTSSMQFTARLSAQIGANLTGAYICPTPIAVSPFDVPDAYALAVEETRKLEDLAYASRDSFVAWTRALGVAKPRWQVAEGYVPEVLARLGNRHDLVVVGRNDHVPSESPTRLGKIVLENELPCLIVPPGLTQPAFDCIALAWNGSPEGMRAIHAARPLLARAKRLVVLRGALRTQFSEIGWQPEFDLSDYLSGENLRAESHLLETDEEKAGAALLQAAARHGADMLVMGAFGRSRFSEWIFGGATRHVLGEATLPVLMRH